MTPLKKLLEEFDNTIFPIDLLSSHDNDSPYIKIMLETREKFRKFLTHAYTTGEEAGLKAGRASMAEEVRKVIKSNSKGSFTDDGGNDCWYIDDLLAIINQLEKE